MIELQTMHFIKIIKIIFFSLILITLGYFYGKYSNSLVLDNNQKHIPKKLIFNKYSIPNLRKTQFNGSNIVIREEVPNNSNNGVIRTYKYYSYDQNKKVSGLLNFPKQEGEYPIAILIRGYVDKEIYTSGIGTQRVAEYLASNGYITLAPDFLGYGDSDKEAKHGLEGRFQTYTTTLELLASLKNLNTAFEEQNIDVKANTNKIVLWGHSNGGHIALAVLAITGKNYSTVLWAPVSKPFPYSILFYTDEYSDRGKYLRKLLADFEVDYDIEKFNPANYYQWIKAPIQIHQGTLDKDVPIDWSNDLYDQLKKLKKDVEYFTYEGVDHNLMPNGWSSAVSKMMLIYNKL